MCSGFDSVEDKINNGIDLFKHTGQQMKRDIFNIIHEMIYGYEKYTDEKPYIILVTPEIYIEIREYLEITNAWRYLGKIENEKDKINYIFGIPVEISRYILQNAICMNEKEYHKYCIYKYMHNILED